MSAPFFVVGCPRSGTTLLRLMLDAHPDVAIPPESHFVLGLRPRVRPFDAERTLAALLGHRWFRRWRLDPSDVAAAVRAKDPATHAELVDAVFAHYADQHGAVRWGDKTPGYVDHLRPLAALFPEARFVHVIRDGREVARSLAEREWGPRSVVSGGFWWRRRVGAGRRAGRTLGGRYLEVRYERLVAEPAAELDRIGGHLGLEVVPAMLRPHRRVTERMGVRPGAPSTSAVRNLSLPPTPGIRDWADGLVEREQQELTAACGRPLLELGYVDALPGSDAARAAWLRRLSDLALTAPGDVAARLRPSSRDY